MGRRVRPERARRLEGSRVAALTRVCFRGGSSGEWRVLRMQTLAGPPLEPVACLNRQERSGPAADGAVWSLHGVTSHQRYVYGREKLQLETVQAGIGRAEATRAALIPISKSPAWWDLPQDERRAIFEERSHHISESLKYLPAIARRLYHARELGEPFDFLTWFEFAPEHADLFDELVAMLRATEEWGYLDREVDIRLTRATGSASG